MWDYDYLMPDYAKGENLATTWIRWPCMRISTASFPSKSGFPDSLIETLVISDCPHQRFIQVSHRLRSEAMKAHAHIAENMKKRLLEVNRKLILFRRFDLNESIEN